MQYQYEKYFSEINGIDKIQYPSTLKSVSNLEKLNDFAIYVYVINSDNSISPLYKSTKENVESTKIIPLISHKNHFVLIKNMSRLLSTQLTKMHTKVHICYRCCYHTHNEETYKTHVESCNSINNNIAIKMPKNKYIEFKNHHKMHTVPYVVYADIESILTTDSKKKGNNSVITQNHIPSMACFQVVSIDETENWTPQVFEGSNCISDMIDGLQNVYKHIEQRFKNPSPIIMSAEAKQNYKNTDTCYCCQKKFDYNGLVLKKNDKFYWAHGFRCKGLKGVSFKKAQCPICSKAIKNDNKAFIHQDNQIKPCCHSCIVSDETKIEPINSETKCYNCDWKIGQDKVKDHCHISGLYRGASCNQCNINMRCNYQLPIFFHNFEGYDSHPIILEAGQRKYSIKPIANNLESYSSVVIDKHLKFLDSFKFMSASLDNLAKNMKPEDLKFIRKFARDEEQFKLLTKKGVYPYDYMTSWSRLSETELPPIEAFQSNLAKGILFQNDEKQENIVNISSDQYEHAKNVWNAFKIRNLNEYTMLYLITDVLLLADIFENFRKVSKERYQLEPCNYVSLPSFSYDCMLKMTKAKIELIQDQNIYLFMERSMRGGICFISKRYCEANNKYVNPTIKEGEKSNYITYLDANNLYGLAMSKRLPFSDFKWVDDIGKIDIHNVPSIDEASNVGYFVEATLEAPEELHDHLKDYPIAMPQIVKNEWLSLYQQQFSPKEDTSAKLVPTLRKIEKQVFHYKNLIAYEKEGYKITMHRAVQFVEKAFLKPYIEFNTNLRTIANQNGNAFEKDFFKLMNNAMYGKNLENVRNHRNTEMVSRKDRLIKLVSSHKFKNVKVFDENLAIVESKRTQIEMNKPIAVGCAILELSKVHMWSYHYDFKSKFDCELLMTDTDSLVYNVKSDKHDFDLYAELKKDSELYDFSNYKKDHPCYDAKNTAVIGKFKDELGGTLIKSFVGLRAKMYSVLTQDDVEMNKAKGVAKSCQKLLRHKMYKETLETKQIIHVEQTGFRTEKHKVYTLSSKKIGLSAYDNKKYLLENGIDSLPYGHRLTNL